MLYFWPAKSIALVLSSVCCLPQALSAPPVLLGSGVQLEAGGEPRPLADWEQLYIEQAVDRLFASCEAVKLNADTVTEEADVETRQADSQVSSSKLSVRMNDGLERVIELHRQEPTRDPTVTMYERAGEDVQRLSACNRAYLLPVASIIEGHELGLANTKVEAAEPEPQIIDTGDRWHAYHNPDDTGSVGLTSYKPNRLGWTFDEDGVEEGYLDAFISIKYPLFHDGRYRRKDQGYNPNLYLAFSGRFSQYIESIDSSPVVGKQFNPKLFSRWWLRDESSYVDIGYAHESNGQSISTAGAYQSEREKYLRSDGDADFARNYISRGWDYVSLDWAQSWDYMPGDLSSAVMLKYFMEDGFLQGEPEEYNDWENDGVHQRKQYDGVSFLARYEFRDTMCLTRVAQSMKLDWELDVCLHELSWEYSTGYDDVFAKSTNRAEFAVNFWNLPVMIWIRTGYNSDLVDYYQELNSWGIALELESGHFF